ncbi:hypothetical protein [Kitasatospora aureofaciens]|uniref:hypothetical protein n=1 Tax=Kitasatospora aureofaciens TaxID=1894 RepID=UPI003800F0E3
MYAPAVGGRGTVLHLAVLVGRGTQPWAGCGRAHRLGEDRLLFANETGTARPCTATGCAGNPWNGGCGAPPIHR